MEAILPFGTVDRELFCANAMEIGFDEFVALKFVYVMQDSDLDVFQLMGQDRLSLLLYGWEMCNNFIAETLPADDGNVAALLSENVRMVMKRLTHDSLELWFSREWEKLAPRLQSALLLCLKRAKPVLAGVPELSLLNWEYLFRLGAKPWDVHYLRRFVSLTEKPLEALTQSIETVEDPASDEDIAYLQKEGLFVILLRLIKMFDTGSMESVKNLSMRIIAAWNHVYEQIKENSELAYPKVRAGHKSCLVLICHIYLMTVYESDGTRGFVIDNMMNNIRFYHQNIQEKSAEDESVEGLEFSPARYIAMTCVNLRFCSSFDFFESFIFDTFDECFTTLFGVISQAYMSYILGNLLMEMNNMNEQDFKASIDDYKRIMNLYVQDRERSEMYMLSQMRKQEAQRNSHNTNVTMKNMTDYRSKICKGNRMSNIGNYECADDIEEKEEKTVLEHQESDRRIDPIFQNIPNNEIILSYVYNELAKRSYKGWHFAKLTLLIKIIGHELNVIETWRYHPGLTTNFMLGLETKLSHHYADLAKIFQDHDFMAQEFWMTAFYLNPNPKYYEAVMKCGMRFNRKRYNANDAIDANDANDENAKPEEEKSVVATATTTSTTSGPADINAKFGLLSSTIDVQEIVGMTNHDEPNADYEPLCVALRSFRLPEAIINDLLTVTFLPRNKSFAWAVNWVELRTRCKVLLKDTQRKRRLVELNMAEANDRLKFLKIDYEKYKHRPQLDYGTIEVGYETVLNYDDYAGGDSDNDIDEDDKDEKKDELKRKRTREPNKKYEYRSDDEYDEKEDFWMEKKRARKPNKKYEYRSEDEDDEDKTEEDSDISETYFTGTRRTRARIAAVKATAMFRDEQRSKRGADKFKEDSNDSNDMKYLKSGSHSPAPSDDKVPAHMADEKPQPAAKAAAVTMRNLKNWLDERTTYSNATSGFKAFPDLWHLESQELQTVAEEDSLAVLQTENVLDKFAKLKLLKKSITKNKPIKKPRKALCDVEKALAQNQLLLSGGLGSRDDDDLDAEDDEMDADFINHLNETEEQSARDEKAAGRNMTNLFGAVPIVDEVKRKKSATDDTDDTDETRSASETAEYLEECRLAASRKARELFAKPVANRNTKLSTAGSDKMNVHSSSRLGNLSLNSSQVDDYDSNSSDVSTEALKDLESENDEKRNMIETDACDKDMRNNVKSLSKDNGQIQQALSKNAVAGTAIKNIQTTTDNINQDKACVKYSTIENTKSKNDAEKQAVPSNIEAQMKSMHAEEDNDDDDDDDDQQPLSQILKNLALDEATQHENDELLKQCSQKTLQVTLRRLTVSDVCQLRQPMLRLKRVNVEDALTEDQEQEQSTKRRRVQRKFYADSDDCSKSSSGGSLYSDGGSHSKKPAPSRRTAIRGIVRGAGSGPARFFAQRKRNASESSTESEDIKIKRRVGRPSRGRGGGRGGGGVSGATSQRGRGGIKSLMVTPRSASGLKLRISGIDNGAPGTSASSTANVKLVKRSPIVEFIQISSSSDPDDSQSGNKFLSPVVELMETDDSSDPLFEEEVITYD